MENTQKHNPKARNKQYEKDYTKLETVFNAAVQKSKQRNIVYYASDRLDSNRKRTLESYKAVSWAEPIDQNDREAEIIDITTNKRLLKVHPFFIENEQELRKILSKSEFAQLQSVIEETSKQNEIKENQTLEEKFEEATNNVVQNKVVEKALKEPDDSKEIKQRTKNRQPIEQEHSETPFKQIYEEFYNLDDHIEEVTDKRQGTEDTSPIFVEEISIETVVETIPDQSTSEENESFTFEEDALIDLESLVAQDFSNEEFNFNQDDLDLLDLIQQSGSDVEEETVIEITTPDDEFGDLSEIFKEIEDTSEIIFETGNIDLSEEANVSIPEETYNETFVVEEKPEKRKVITQKESQELHERIKNAYKDLTASKVAFIGCVALLCIYAGFMYPSFQGYDYIALMLSVVGIFIAWDLNTKHLIIVCSIMLVTLILCMFYFVYQTAASINFLHYLWFLIIPLVMSTSYAYINSKKIYDNLIKESKNSIPVEEKIEPVEFERTYSTKPITNLEELVNELHLDSYDEDSDHPFTKNN